MATVHVRGVCPCCRRRELEVDDDQVVCGADDCPRPDAITDLLERFAAVKA